jgi:DNA-binding transcriptional MerR regulator
VTDRGRYSIDELAELGGVSRRTVRYYVQEGLLPAPLGVGRGRHYDSTHLDHLQRVKALQEAGRSLQEIRVALCGRPAEARAERRPDAARALRRSAWRRFELAPGVELHVSADSRLPAQGRLDELAAWCRQHFPHDPSEDSQ